MYKHFPRPLIGKLFLAALLLGPAFSGAETVTNSRNSSSAPTPNVIAGNTLASAGPEMNGIRYNDYIGFQDNWKLITVHYRTDTGELRFVYANPKAYDAVMSGQTDYPDGAVFAKIAVVSEDDPEFIDSKVPMGALRNQFMVRDKVKYASTGGWGFAIFIPHHQQDAVMRDKKNDPENCFACHQVAKDRGFVFSFPARLNQDQAEAMETGFPHAPMLNFSDYASENVPPKIRALLPLATNKVRLLVVPAESDSHLLFLGEFRPMLMREAAKSGLPALYFSKSIDSYIIVIPLKQDHLPDGFTCPDGQKAYETFGSEHFDIGQYFCD